ncbi:MAG: hypothetical protein J1F69_06195, partial [Clostridiales bacterium]|nr:hypothetical protein [Clostridiales bacterium]
MKKLISIILSLLLLTAVAFVGCNSKNNNESGNKSGKEYNIIFTLGTIPPVLAALDCINNGNET